MFPTLQSRVSRRINRLLGSGAMRRLFRLQDGAAAVEFALVAAPFLALLFAIMETALVFFAGQALDTVAASSARQIMTGQSQSMNQTNFMNNVVCANVYALFNCSSMMIDVETYSSWSTVNVNLPIDSNGNVESSSFQFQQGGPGSIVVMRLMYPWPTFMSLLGFSLANTAGNQRLLMSTVAFCNEPF